MILFLALSVAQGAPTPAEEEWSRVTALDSGPQGQARNPEESRSLALAHLETQEKTVRQFIAAYPEDTHAFEARLRLSRILGIRADVQGVVKAKEEGDRLLDYLAKVATPQQLAEVDFARITSLMRTMGKPTPEQRDRLFEATRKFQRSHPEDRRLAHLLTEVASLYSLQPKLMRSLLVEADRLTSNADLKAQIADDLKRLDRIGQPLDLKFVTADGKAVESAQFRGSVVLILFFATWSAPSLEALDVIQKAAAQLPPEGFQLLGVSLDVKPEALTKLRSEKKISWPVGFDGKGWESPVVRSIGINSLPSVWLLDRKGRLRSINALESTVNQTKQLLNER